jgi:hypothetical protein
MDPSMSNENETPGSSAGPSSAPTAAMQKKSRRNTSTASAKKSRKPKMVYNGFEEGTGMATSMSDDENIILQLNVCDVQVVDAKKMIDPPDAYNKDNINSFESSPCEFYQVGQGSILPPDPATTATATDDEDVDIDLMTASVGYQPRQHDNNQSGNSILKIVDLLKDFEEKSKQSEWPNSTSVCCYWCCHKFDTTPFGLPIKCADDIFHVLGCFCSLECAAAHNFSSSESMDEIWERNSLTNLLAKKLDLNTPIKPAPNRLSLKMFGGFLEIEDFRNYCQSSKIITINFPPMMAVTQQVEEVFESDITCDYKYVPLDHARVDRYKEKLRLKRAKPLINPRNTLDFSMNLKINS